MGFGLFWVMQFHMSWIYLAAFGGLSFILQLKNGVCPLWKAAGAFLLGAIPPGSLILPTLFRYGFSVENAGNKFFMNFNPENFRQFFTILARYFSFASFEMPSFLEPPGSVGFENWGSAMGPDHPWLGFFGPHTHFRLQFLAGSILMFVPGIFLWILGLLQPLVMLVMWFFKKHKLKDWTGVRWLILFNIGIIWASFWFTMKWPLAHIYYVCFPVIFLYSLYCWSRFSSPGWRTFAKVYLAAAFIFQVAYAWRIYPVYSLYRDRPRIVKALQEKDYRIVGERRAGVLY